MPTTVYLNEEDFLSLSHPFSIHIVSKTDWRELQKQKLLLLELSRQSFPEHTTQKLNGIISFLDTIQDFVVDYCGLPEDEVFNK